MFVYYSMLHAFYLSFDVTDFVVLEKSAHAQPLDTRPSFSPQRPALLRRGKKGLGTRLSKPVMGLASNLRKVPPKYMNHEEVSDRLHNTSPHSLHSHG